MPSLGDERQIRVLFVVPHPIEGPSSRFRVYQFLPYLKANGVRATIRPFLSSKWAPLIYRPGRRLAKAGVTGLASLHRLFDLAGSARFDLVYVLREAFPFGPPVLERAFKRIAGRLIFDFDDAIYRPSLAYQNPLDRLRDWSKTEKVIRIADHVVAGSSYLADYARRFTPGERVSVLPTVVDTSVFTPRDPRSGEPLTIGWIGTPRSSSYLKDLKGAIAKISGRLGQVRFVFVGAEPFDAGGLPVEFRPWRLDREVADIASFDIGIMPLHDDEETRGKCGFKLIEYMSMGVPVVCSPVGANREIISDTASGLFAISEEDWVRTILMLAQDKSLRLRLAEAGRERVQQAYSLDIVAPQLLAILRKTAARELPPAKLGHSPAVDGSGKV